jgi:NADPH:quinone reductase-like Zn-dependent oxidoreductase
MKAAVLQTPGTAPRFAEFSEPVAGEGEVIVRMKAAALNQISKLRASGMHYSSDQQYPQVCGFDGIGVLADDTRVYFVGGMRPPYGSMAERTVVQRAFCIPVPDGIDDLTAAALPNAAISAWLPLVYRAQIQAGETVLVLGATGVSGKLAIQAAKYLGAGRVIAVGRNEQILQTLPALGADVVISLNQPEKELLAVFKHEALKQPFDIILDYLWGQPAELLLQSIASRELMATRPPRCRFITIGAIAGESIALASTTLRSSTIELYGSGIGSIAPEHIVAAFSHIWTVALQGKFQIATRAVALADVESLWNYQDADGRRLVFVP